MASYQISPPEKFNFREPDKWPVWIRRFQRFSQASGLTEKGEESQVNALVYCMGPEADDIMASFGLNEADSKKFDTVKAKFEAHFVKKKNVVFERAKFNLRKQEDGEAVDSFITSLYKLSEHCAYGNLRDELIRDRIVIGVRDKKLSMKLQLEDGLTLEKAISTARQQEYVKQEQAALKQEGGITGESVDYLKAGKTYKGGHRSNPAKATPTCSRCGRGPPHPKSACPAATAECHRCHKVGHYREFCRTKIVGEVCSDSSDDEIPAFLGAVGDPLDAKPWMVSIVMNKEPVEFKIDTGADVTVVPEAVFTKLKGTALRPTSKTLLGPGNHAVSVIGKFTAELEWSTSKVQEEVFVVAGMKNSLLGRPAIQSLNLLAKVCSVKSTTSRIIAEHPKLFHGLGNLDGEYHIELKEGAKPFALSTPRRIALPRRSLVKKELKAMESSGIISRVKQPTDWCSGMVVVPKGNKRVRICVDLTKLNDSVKRSRHILPSVEQSLAQLGGAKVFSKLDANSGFWQVKLDQKSALLTTFITPFGRFCFNRLPFGITSGPEYFQSRMAEILDGLEGVVNQTDDSVVYGATQEEHDQRLEAVLRRLEEAGVTLNPEKCVFSTDTIKFLGHIIGPDGIRPDPEKVKAITSMCPPTNTTEVHRFLGMCNQLSKFSPRLAEMSEPLRSLLSAKSTWCWSEIQQKAFEDIKAEMQSDRVLALYHVDLETIVAADASSYGLGAVLLQKQSDADWKPVLFASRTLSSTEQRYAQVEKEALAVTWACERFKHFLLGKRFHICTDHKPLISLLSHKQLDELTVRIQRFRMRLMGYDYSISHVPGKDLIIPDTLSRAPLPGRNPEDIELEEDTARYVQQVVQSLPASEHRLEEIRACQQNDEVCKQIIEFVANGWPPKSQLRGVIKKYYPVASELSMAHGLLLRGSRIVIPSALQSEMLERVHAGHQGIVKCRERAHQSVWWPGLNSQLEDLVFSCTVCQKERRQRPEPLHSTPFPELPWQKLGADLFEWKGMKYLLIVDYFSRFIEIAKLGGESSSHIIQHMKSIIARHGIPQEIFTDNGPQFAAAEFKQFADKYGFRHKTSSPHYPQSNGEAERAVKTIKGLLQKTDDPYHSLLVYRATPLQNGYSPAELLMNRRLRTDLPMVSTQLKPSVPNMVNVRAKETAARQRREENFDRLHRAKSLDPLQPGDSVWVTDRQEGGVVEEQSAPRSYNVSTPSGTFRRNRQHLNVLPEGGSLEERASPRRETVQVENVPEPQSNPEPQSDPEPQSKPETEMAASGPDPETETAASGPAPASEASHHKLPRETPGVTRTRSGRISVKRTFFDPSQYN